MEYHGHRDMKDANDRRIRCGTLLVIEIKYG